MRESEERYRVLVENVNDVIFSLNSRGCFTYINPVMEQISGYRIDEILGQPFTRFVHPDDLPGLLDSLQRTLAGGLEPFELRMLDRDGTIRQVRTSSRLLLEGGQPAGLTGIMTDITERKSVEEGIRRAKEEWERTFDAVTDPIMILDEQYRVVRANKVVTDRLGIAPEEIVGQVCCKLFRRHREGTRGVQAASRKLWDRFVANCSTGLRSPRLSAPMLACCTMARSIQSRYTRKR